MHSATTGLALGSNRHSRSHLRKKKNRIVNLRKSKTTDDVGSETGESEETESLAAASEPIMPARTPEEPEDNILTPPEMANQKVHFRQRSGSIDLGETPVQLDTPAPEQILGDAPSDEKEPSTPKVHRPQRPSYDISNFGPYPVEKGTNSAAAASNASVPISYPPAPTLNSPSPATPGGILEQAWMMKMAGEIARHAQQAKAREAFWTQSVGDEQEAPPAYEPKAT